MDNEIPFLTEALTPNDEHSQSAKELKAVQGKPEYLEVARKWSDWQAENVIEAVIAYSKYTDVVKPETPGDITLIADSEAKSIEIVDYLISLDIGDDVELPRDREEVLNKVKEDLKSPQSPATTDAEQERALKIVRDIIRLDEVVGDRWWLILSAGVDFYLFKRQIASVKKFARFKNGTTGRTRFLGSMGGRANWKNYFDVEYAGQEDVFMNREDQEGLVGRLRVIEKIVNDGVFTPDTPGVPVPEISESGAALTMIILGLVETNKEGVVLNPK